MCNLGHMTIATYAVMRIDAENEATSASEWIRFSDEFQRGAGIGSEDDSIIRSRLEVRQHRSSGFVRIHQR